MKKLLSFVLILIICLTSVSAFAKTMYAPDGRTIDVSSKNISMWENVGWYRYPVTTLYASDGRSIVVRTEDVAMWENVGWYSNTNKTLYALDGRTISVPRSAINTWTAVGWYTSPVMKVYAPGGRSTIIYKNDYDAWQSVGWSKYPYDYTMVAFRNLSRVSGSDSYRYLSVTNTSAKSFTGKTFNTSILPGGSFESSNNSGAEFYLGREYFLLKGTLAVRYPDPESELKVEIYGDNKLIYTSPTMNSKFKPLDFELDISSFDYLKIKFVPLGGDWDLWGDTEEFFIGDATVYKAL